MEKKNANDDELVSIIIPVYNVEDYMDECLESVVNQTYKNLEIVLINDGSTDSSPQKCQEWAKKDSRIRYISKQNEGLGPTRNLGVNIAKGKWIVFVDSDDWLDLRFVSILHNAAIESNADLVDCNFKIWYVQNGEEKISNDFSAIGCRLEGALKYTYALLGVIRRLINRKILIDYGIEQPNCKSQDIAVSLLISAGAKNRIAVEDVLYNYRKGRANAVTTNRNCNRKDGAYAMQWLVDSFVRNGMFTEWYEILKKEVSYKFSRSLIAAWMEDTDEDYVEIKETFVQCWRKNFLESHVSIMHIGSWNLMSAIRLIPYIQDINMSCQFSSLISIANESNFMLEHEHKNKMRRKMIARDIKSDFWKVMEIERPDYLVMDLLEERHNILQTVDGYITKSDALDKCEYNISSVREIDQETEEWFDLWQVSCDIFMSRLKHYLTEEKIIVVNNLLVSQCGEVGKISQYENQEWIRCKNVVLQKCYDYIKEKYSKVHFIDVTQDEYYFTDIKYEYGVQPWYLNTLINEKIAEEVMQILKN